MLSSTEYDAKKLLKAFKKVPCFPYQTPSYILPYRHRKHPTNSLQEFACNGTLVEDEEMGQVIQLQGDQRVKISQFLTEEGIPKTTIKIHGF